VKRGEAGRQGIDGVGGKKKKRKGAWRKKKNNQSLKIRLGKRRETDDGGKNGEERGKGKRKS